MGIATCPTMPSERPAKDQRHRLYEFSTGGSLSKTPRASYVKSRKWRGCSLAKISVNGSATSPTSAIDASIRESWGNLDYWQVRVSDLQELEADQLSTPTEIETRIAEAQTTLESCWQRLRTLRAEKETFVAMLKRLRYFETDV